MPTIFNSKTSMKRIYDRYYHSNYYNHRYPLYNENSLSIILKTINSEKPIILDYGCGNGRYTFPLLKQTEANLVLFDISQVALNQVKSSLKTAYISRVKICVDISELNNIETFDNVICMFGVLSHIPNRINRIDLLKTFFNKLKNRGDLVISVPNMHRRFLMEQFICSVNRFFNNPLIPASEKHDIIYKRNIQGVSEKIFYHLYNKHELINDLEKAGFKIKKVFAESILPEKLVVSSSFFRNIDNLLLKIIPSSLGYGIICIAERDDGHE